MPVAESYLKSDMNVTNADIHVINAQCFFNYKGKDITIWPT